MSAPDLETVLRTLHRTAAAIAAEDRPPARIRLGAAGVSLEWDAVPCTPAPPTTAATPALTVPVPAAVSTPAEPTAGPGPGPVLTGHDAVPATDEAAATGHVLTAPTVGVFYRAPEPGAAAFVDTGDLVVAGQQVGIVEAMKLMIPVEADRGGRITEVLCDDATPVEFGAALFALAAEQPG